MTDDDYDARLRRFYALRMDVHEGLAQGDGWGSRELQRRRFEVLVEALDEATLRTASILDVGCGTGDLIPFLVERGWQGRYAGVDALPDMIARARAQHPEHAFEVARIEDLVDLPMFDLVVASGIFAVFTADEMQAAIPLLFARARRALAFNCLSAWAHVQQDGELYLEPAVALAWSRASSSRVVLRCDYLPNDFTMYVRRDAPARAFRAR
jgi:SAM-dependent methyltransferase